MEDYENSPLLGLLCPEHGCDDGCMLRLIQEETLIFGPNYSNKHLKKSDRSWLKHVRLEVIEWIRDTRANLGFHYSTAYLALIYFDQFLSSRTPREDKKVSEVWLLSVACLSLAAKMQEREVPTFFKYAVDFEEHFVQEMESLVLNVLECQMKLVTPFSYLHCFFSKFCVEHRSEKMLRRAIDLILAVIEDINLVEERPSVVAAGAVLAAFEYEDASVANAEYTNELERKLETKVHEISEWGSFKREHIFSSYSQMQSANMLKLEPTIDFT